MKGSNMKYPKHKGQLMRRKIWPVAGKRVGESKRWESVDGDGW